MSYQDLDDKQATLALWYIVNTSLTAFYKLIDAFDNAKNALTQPQTAWQTLGIHTAHIKRWSDVADTLAFVGRIRDEWQRGAYGVLFVGDDEYPSQLSEIYDPPPVLFYRGNVARLSDKQIAIVGSRNPTDHAQKTTFDMAQYLAYSGFTVTSGLAVGVDKSAHLGALSQDGSERGRTVGVMGTGIDVCYPKNHNALYAQIIQDGGCLVSELLPSTPASKHTFPRRNRLVAGLSLATLVTEAAMQSGSLITARLTAEQGKQVFAVPSLIDNINAEGCHHLIREGATLVYHPNQILEELGEMGGFNALPKTFSRGVSAFGDEDNEPYQEPKNPTNQTPTPLVAIPEHLTAVFDLLTDTPVDLDSLVVKSDKDVGSLLASLLELELLGVVKSIGGRYGRV